MPIPFRLLGYTNGFNKILTRLSEDDDLLNWEIIKDVNLKKAMDWYWNMYRLEFRGSASIDFHHQHYYVHSFDFDTEYEKTIYDEYGRKSKMALFQEGGFATEPKDRNFNAFYIYDDLNRSFLTIKGPYLNDIDYNISKADIRDPIYAFKIRFYVDFMSYYMIVATTDSITSPNMTFQKSIDVKFENHPFKIYIHTLYSEFETPEYHFEISDIVPKIYTPSDYNGGTPLT